MSETNQKLHTIYASKKRHITSQNLTNIMSTLKMEVTTYINIFKNKPLSKGVLTEQFQ